MSSSSSSSQQRLAILSSHLSPTTTSSSGSVSPQSTQHHREPLKTFHGHICHKTFNPPSSGLEWGPFKPKPFGEYDIDVAITHCGICGSDLHTLKSGWGGTKYPIVVGHEIIGHAIQIGSSVSSLPHPITLGDRVGIGAQAFSCHKDTCQECSSHQQNHCRYSIDTYNGRYSSGYISQGGYATHIRIDARFAFQIPDSLPSELAAPLMCAGVTVYSPLRQLNAGPGKTIAVIGIGGLGHLAILFAKAMGVSHILALSRSESKRADALSLGASEYIATDSDPQGTWSKRLARTVDGIVCTVSSSSMPIRQYLRLLKVGGKFIMVGAPDGGKMPEINVFQLIAGNISIGGSAVGSPDMIRECLGFAAEKGVRPWVEVRSMRMAEEAVRDMDGGRGRFRYVLVNDDEKQKQG